EPHLAVPVLPADPELLHGKLPVERRHHDVAVSRLDRAVHDDDVAGVDAGLYHGVALDLGEVRRRRVRDAVLVEADLPIDVIVGGAREPGRDAGEVERELERVAGLERGDVDEAGWRWPEV